MYEAHFQSFDDPAPAQTGPRVQALRAELSRRGLSGLILPRADRHQNEYVPPSEERLAWLTGFTGSAGVTVVLADRAALFVDGRYTLQAAAQVDTSVFTVIHVAETPPERWLEANLIAGAKLGYDPWLHTVDGAERLAHACANVGATLMPTEPNPVDALWADRPAPPLGPVSLHDLRFAGEYASSKLNRIRTEIAGLRADALVVSDPHAVAWTFNIRGSDVAHTPLPLAFAIVPQDGRPTLYVDSAKLSNAVRHRLEEAAEVREPADFIRDLAALGEAHRTVRLDQATAADALARIVTVSGGRITRGADPIALMKAVKNPVEIEGAREAHRRDGAAMARFLAWFDREAPKGELTEIAAVEALESFRRDTGLLKDVSFPSISGAGADGAIVHYRVTRSTNRVIAPGEIFLIDSGAQYEDGTTDITRTVAVGEPDARMRDEMRDRFTRVLKGHIAIARAVFPEGVSGAQLDPFARQSLWEVGLDFDHGTGHGVGSYLSVHEGPARISKLGNTPLKRGMILSNEPGYYKAGAYGVRIENLILVTDGPEIAEAEKPLNAFETLTLAPIDRRLIEPSLLNAEELSWLDAYHARVAEALMPLVDDETQSWLAAATRPIG
ncbi:MAG TPA: aminopeptidase P family protein [Xanthobacteraceae bacterium]|nr:aminopeptidase P family protein [Xanthobacteraceae bacterium]